MNIKIRKYWEIWNVIYPVRRNRAAIFLDNLAVFCVSIPPGQVWLFCGGCVVSVRK